MPQKAAEYIVRFLQHEGVTRFYVIQGAANSDILDSLRACNAPVTFPHHEQAAGFMAEGYAKASKGVGCAIATSGPGAQNLVTAIANCYYDSVPVIFITGQVNSQFMTPEGSGLRQLGFQETPITKIVEPITKFALCVTDAASLPETLEVAFLSAIGGRPGPVLLDIPIDVQRVMLDDETAAIEDISNEKLSDITRDGAPDIDEAKVDVLVDRLSRAKRPVVLIGGGVSARKGGASAVQDLMIALPNVPFFPTWNALDAVPSDSPNYGGRIGTYGGAGRNFAIQNADFLLAIGSRISGRITGGRVESFARHAWRCYVDIDEDLLHARNQPVHAHLNIHADCIDFMRMLVDRLPNKNTWERKHLSDVHSAWMQQARAWRDRYDPVTFMRPQTPLATRVNPYSFIRALSYAAPENAIIVGDCGGNLVTMSHAFETKLGQRFITNNGNSPMGFSLAAAIGASEACPSRPVIAVIGDGGFMMNIQELATLWSRPRRIALFVLDNHGYGISRAFQTTHFGSRFIGTQNTADIADCDLPLGASFGTFDVEALARGFLESSGVPLKGLYLHTSQPKEGTVPIQILHQLALLNNEHAHATIGVVNCGTFIDYHPAVRGWNTPIEDMWPLLPRDEFRANMLDGNDPLPGWETGEYK